MLQDQEMSFSNVNLKSSSSPQRNNTNISYADIIDKGSYVFKIKSHLNPFKWDGTYLGIFHDNNIIDITIVDQFRYWKINLFGHVTVCLVKMTNTTCPSVSDELKYIFGIRKTGTHYFKYKGRIHTALNLIPDNSWKIDIIHPVKHNLSPEFIKEVQLILLFRDILGVSNTSGGNIYVLEKESKDQNDLNQLYAMSFYENLIKVHISSKTLPRTLTDKWLVDTDLNFIAQDHFGVRTIDDIPRVFDNLRQSVEETIYRVDPNAIWISNFVLNKLLRRISIDIKQT